VIITCKIKTVEGYGRRVVKEIDGLARTQATRIGVEPAQLIVTVACKRRL
jgi:hypothetical protein